MIFHREEATLTAPERNSHEKKDCGCSSSTCPFRPPSRGVAEAQGRTEHSGPPAVSPATASQSLRRDLLCCVTLGKVGAACSVFLS